MQFITPNVGQCTAVTLLKPWSSVTNFWLMGTRLAGRLISCHQHVNHSPSGNHVPSTLTHLSSELLFFQCTLKYAILHSWYDLSLPFSTFFFFKQSQSMYKSERFLHGVSLDRKMGIQKGQGTNLLMILLLALFRNTEKLKIPCSYQDEDRRHSEQKYSVQ